MQIVSLKGSLVKNMFTLSWYSGCIQGKGTGFNQGLRAFSRLRVFIPDLIIGLLDLKKLTSLALVWNSFLLYKNWH
jgi:hypothetical protein